MYIYIYILKNQRTKGETLGSFCNLSSAPAFGWGPRILKNSCSPMHPITDPKTRTGDSGEDFLLFFIFILGTPSPPPPSCCRPQRLLKGRPRPLEASFPHSRNVPGHARPPVRAVCIPADPGRDKYLLAFWGPSPPLGRGALSAFICALPCR
uniref:Uncharacterized protein n=1 Tax=Myotis myotis TaxID=51298 RepID=A0A7J7RS03_MYOMY|nr:hypothetical protein mMyoMyo1_010228 [Myotis myotis]